MNIKTTQHGGITVLKLQGNLMGGPDATSLNAKLHELLEHGKKQIVIDLAEVEFINSSGLGILIGGASAVKNAGGALRFAEASEKIQTIIKIAKLASILELHPTLDTALSSFKK